MPQYKVTFKVPATVLVTLVVDEPHVEDALVSAHDLVKSKAPSADDRILDLCGDDASLDGICRVEAPEPSSQDTNPPSPLSGRVDFRVHLYEGQNESTPLVREVTGLSYEAAVSIADSVEVMGSVAGFAQVISFDKNVQYEIRATRGGWEVKATPKNLQTHEVRFVSWLEEKEAQAKAMELFLTGRYTQVEIFDFNNRARARLVRTLKAAR